MLISFLEKFSLFHLEGLITVVLMIWKWIGLFFRKNHPAIFFRFLSLLNQIIISIDKIPFKKIEALIHYLRSFFFSQGCSFILWVCMEYCCHVAMAIVLICFIRSYMFYKICFINGYGVLLVLYVLLLLNPWLMVQL